MSGKDPVLKSIVDYGEAVRQFGESREVVTAPIGLQHSVRVHLDPERGKLAVAVFDRNGKFKMGLAL